MEETTSLCLFLSLLLMWKKIATLRSACSPTSLPCPPPARGVSRCPDWETSISKQADAESFNWRKERQDYLRLPLGESPDEDVAKPELSVKVTKTDLWIKTEIWTTRSFSWPCSPPNLAWSSRGAQHHPSPTENTIVNISLLTSWSTWNTIHPPPSVSRSQYTWKAC